VIAANAAAAANCGPANYVRISDSIGLYGILSQRYVCAERGSDTWRECHGIFDGTSCTGPSSQLWDLKRGINDPVDPSEQVGTWVVTNDAANAALVTYDYGTGGGAYTYEVWRDPNAIPSNPFPLAVVFCGTSPQGNNVTTAVLRESNDPCN